MTHLELIKPETLDSLVFLITDFAHAALQKPEKADEFDDHARQLLVVLARQMSSEALINVDDMIEEVRTELDNRNFTPEMITKVTSLIPEALISLSRQEAALTHLEEELGNQQAQIYSRYAEIMLDHGDLTETETKNVHNTFMAKAHSRARTSDSK